MKKNKDIQFNIIIIILAILYSKALIALTIFGRDVGGLAALTEARAVNQSSINIIPMANIINYITSFDMILFMKILMDLPLGYFLNIKLDFKKSLLIGTVISVIMESIQYYFHTGNFEVDTIILNIIGIIIGIVVCMLIKNEDSDKNYIRITFFITAFLVIFNLFLNNNTDKFRILSWSNNVNIVDSREELGEYSLNQENIVGRYISSDIDLGTIKIEVGGKTLEYNMEDRITTFDIFEFEKDGKIGYSVQNFSKSWDDYSVDNAISIVEGDYGNIKFYEDTPDEIIIWESKEGKVEAIGSINVRYSGRLK